MFDTPPARFQRKADFGHNGVPTPILCTTMWQARLTHVCAASDAVTAFYKLLGTAGGCSP